MTGGEKMTEGKPSAQKLSLDGRRIVIIGLGGIGSWLVQLVTNYLRARRDDRVDLLLVDGDDFEERNRERMDVPDIGNKSEVLCEELSVRHGRPRLRIRPIPEYVNEDNVAEIILERDIVLLGVDNHATRKVVSDHAESLQDVVLISGGNDGVEDGVRGTYGNVQLFRREGGEERNPPITRFHPEIANPADEVPGPSCADLADQGVAQIIFTNHLAATVMGSVFFGLVHGGAAEFDEVCFDVLEGRVVGRSY